MDFKLAVVILISKQASYIVPTVADIVNRMIVFTYYL